MAAWREMFVPEKIVKALEELKFDSPTPIQSLAIPCAIRDYRDILGAAETGSGKTLAFGIPIITRILSLKEHQKNVCDSNEGKPLYSLVLTPTRELAIQIKKHLQDVCKYTDIKISTVVGGMAPEKQHRILKKCPEIVVATPGRLWELIDEGEEHLSKVPSVKLLVIDEADRMLEKGHFAELSQILNLINIQNSKRQNFVFSATLTLVHDTPKRLIFKKNQQKMQQKMKLESLVNSIGMRQPKVIDITRKTALVETLSESQIMCSIEEKDFYLYYFVYVHPGRTIIFCNSIDCVRRLRTVLEYLNCNPLPLHAQMHQKQRLKNLERFASSQKAILLATDVAARGLDIRGIEHVIHYQVPRTAETYIHRSGRTARAQSEGLSLMLVEPQEGMFYKRIYKTLNKDKPLPNFPVDQNIFKALKERVTLARLIDKSEHRIKRLSAQNRWLLNAAKEMDIDIDDDDNLLNDMGSQQEHAAKTREINNLKKKLKSLLKKFIVPKTLTGSYPTKSGKLVCPLSKDSQKALKVLKREQKKRKRNDVM